MKSTQRNPPSIVKARDRGKKYQTGAHGSRDWMEAVAVSGNRCGGGDLWRRSTVSERMEAVVVCGWRKCAGNCLSVLFFGQKHLRPISEIPLPILGNYSGRHGKLLYQPGAILYSGLADHADPGAGGIVFEEQAKIAGGEMRGKISRMLFGFALDVVFDDDHSFAGARDIPV